MSASAMTTADLYAMLDARRVELGLSQLQLGQLAFGRPDNSGIQNLKRGSSPTFDRLSQLCDALGYELYCGPPRARGRAVGSELPAEAGSPDPAPSAPGYRSLPWHRLAHASGASPLGFQPGWAAAGGHAMAGLAVVAPDICHVPHGPSLETVLAVVDADALRSASPAVWAFL